MASITLWLSHGLNANVIEKYLLHFGGGASP